MFYSSSKDKKFNGEYIKLNRVPNIGEKVCFCGIDTYEVIDVKMKLSAWKEFYEVKIRKVIR